MATITEDYVSFETAKLLKEKGFDGKCLLYYNEYGQLIPVKHLPDYLKCPTLQMAMKWIREVHKIYVQIMLDSWALGSHSGYYIVIQATDSDFDEVSPCEQTFYNTYEEACESAIKYCLENLI